MTSFVEDVEAELAKHASCATEAALSRLDQRVADALIEAKGGNLSAIEWEQMQLAIAGVLTTARPIILSARTAYLRARAVEKLVG